MSPEGGVFVDPESPRQRPSPLLWAAIGVLALVALFVGFDRSDGPVLVEGDRTDFDVDSAVSFVKALDDFDVDLALSYTAVTSDLVGFGGHDALRRQAAWFQAAGVRLFDEKCAGVEGLDGTTLVNCHFDFLALHSGGVAMGFAGGHFEIRVLGGEIIDGTLHLDLAQQAAAIWEPFADWVSTHAPSDGPIMYEDWPRHDLPNQEAESQILWDSHTRQFVADSFEAKLALSAQVRAICASARQRFADEIEKLGLPALPGHLWTNAHRSTAAAQLDIALSDISTLDPPDLYRLRFEQGLATFKQIPETWRQQNPPNFRFAVAQDRFGFGDCLFG